MKTRKIHLQLATGAALAATVAFAPVAQAADNPFGMQKLASGYQLAQADKKVEEKKKDGSCGAGKAKDGSCGAAKADSKKKDGSCGGAKAKDGSCGAKK